MVFRLIYHVFGALALPEGFPKGWLNVSFTRANPRVCRDLELIDFASLFLCLAMSFYPAVSLRAL